MRKYKPGKYRRNRILKFKWKRRNFRLDRRFIGIAFFIALFLAGIGYLGKVTYQSSLFRVKEVKSNIELSSNFKRAVIGKSLFTLNTGRIYSEIREECLECKNIYVRKEFPSALKVEAEKRIPFVQIRRKKFYPLDEEGFIVEAGAPTEFPGLITVEIEGQDSGFKKGYVYKDERINYVFELAKLLKKKKFLSSYSIPLINATYPEAMYFIVNDAIGGEDIISNEVKVIIGKDDIERKLYLFDSVLKEQLKGELSAVKYIDLRYNKVYLGYKR